MNAHSGDPQRPPGPEQPRKTVLSGIPGESGDWFEMTGLRCPVHTELAVVDQVCASAIHNVLQEIEWWSSPPRSI
ncbi:hypothetical protein SGPA1_20724 [Streptomyces misionensis JCM 4497]